MHVKMGKGDKGIKNGHEPGEGNMAGKTGNRKRIIRKSSDEMVLLSLPIHYHSFAVRVIQKSVFRCSLSGDDAAAQGIPAGMAEKAAMNQGKETWPEKLGIERGLSRNLWMKWCFFL